MNVRMVEGIISHGFLPDGIGKGVPVLQSITSTLVEEVDRTCHDEHWLPEPLEKMHPCAEEADESRRHVKVTS